MFRACKQIALIFKHLVTHTYTVCVLTVDHVLGEQQSVQMTSDVYFGHYSTFIYGFKSLM